MSDTGKQIAGSIHLGIDAEADNGDESGHYIRPGDLTDEQIDWLGAWLAGEGWHR